MIERPYCSGCNRHHEIHLGCNEARAVHLLQGLLAVVHRDGGQYAEQYGLEKATEDAAKAWHDLRAQKDGAYLERNQVVAALAKLALGFGYFAGVGQHPAEDTAWEDDWRTILYIDLPEGQASWHFHDSQKHLLEGLPEYTKPYDGHTTPEKYRRVNAVR